MKTIFKLLLGCLLISSFSSFGQTSMEQDTMTYNIKSFSIGLKIGAPNIVGGGAEYVLPFLDHHFSIYGDLSSIDLDIDDASIDLSYSEFGLNYFFNKKGKGIYMGVGLGKFSSDLVISDIELDEGRTGEGAVGLDFNTTNLKLGLKTGGTVYFRLELGYGLGSIPEELVFTATSSDGFSETVTEEVPDIPGISSNGILIGNIGLGLSF